MPRALSVTARVLAWGSLALVLVGLGERVMLVLGPVAAFRLHLGVLAAAVLVPAIVFGARSVALPAAAALGLAAATLGPVWQTAERAPAAAGERVTLLFANVRADNPRTQAMQAALMAEDADIVVVAEAPPAMLGGPLDRAYRHAAVDRAVQGRGQTAIWSRHPLGRADTLRRFSEAPTAAMAVVRLDEAVRLSLIGVHFGRAQSALLEEQLAGLERIAERFAPPLVVVGDFNAAPWTRLVGEAAERTGTEPVGGYRVTWQGHYPVIGLPSPLGHQIDQVLVSPGVGVEGIETVPIPGSDHRGLRVELVVPPPGAALSPALPETYVVAGNR